MVTTDGANKSAALQHISVKTLLLGISGVILAPLIVLAVNHYFMTQDLRDREVKRKIDILGVKIDNFAREVEVRFDRIEKDVVALKATVDERVRRDAIGVNEAQSMIDQAIAAQEVPPREVVDRLKDHEERLRTLENNKKQ